MNLVFTICSVNYLGSAKCLADSISKTNPELKFVYIIADKIEDKIPEKFFNDIEFIEVEQLNISHLNELISTYNLIEFNTAIKPFAVKYLAEKYNASKIIYFDPDIIIFDSLNDIYSKLDSFDFIVTPHILTPITDESFYNHQKGALNTGIFNLGFIAINYNAESINIINWWAYHMRHHGHCNSHIGEFYDQKIMNLLPIFSNKVLIAKHPGYNVAGWNIHERRITKSKDKFNVNNSPLVFYHYSGIIHDQNSKLISNYNSLTTDKMEPLSEILNIYRNELQRNGHSRLISLKCFYNFKPNIHKASRKEMLKFRLKKFFKW
jgi:hypothetical protein